MIVQTQKFFTASVLPSVLGIALLCLLSAPALFADTEEAQAIPAMLTFPGRDFLYVSSDSGHSWQRLNPKTDIADSTYITAAARNPQNSDHFVLGTSFYGLYESTDGGETWEDLDPNADLGLIYQGAGFYNEVAGLLFSANGRQLYLRTGFGGDAYSINLENLRMERIEELGSAQAESPGRTGAQELARANTSDSGSFSAYRPNISSEYIPLYESLIGRGEWPANYPTPPSFMADNTLPQSFARDSAWAERRAQASDRVGIYINSYQFSQRSDELIAYLKDNNFNSVVLDFKDDQGLLRYNSTLPLAEQVGSIRPRYNAEELIARLHAEDMYVIARLVVFKDRALYRYDNSAYALWDKRLNEPWGVYRRFEQEPTEADPDPAPRIEQVEYWVDPYSSFVRNYNIQIAMELEALGVDEIQFDYIRFPSDGRTQDIESRFIGEADVRATGAGGAGSAARASRSTGAGAGTPASAATSGAIDRNSQRVAILASFLSEARSALSIPIGTDVFGFNGWSRMSYLGQDIEVMSHYVDVISPMSYPSHYPRSFYRETSYLDRAQIIYEEGSRRAREITNDRALIRQYVQAFLIGGEVQFETDVYHSYLHRQLGGAVQGGGSGFTLWNNSGRYYMVNDETISDYVRPIFEKRREERITE